MLYPKSARADSRVRTLAHRYQAFFLFLQFPAAMRQGHCTEMDARRSNCVYAMVNNRPYAFVRDEEGKLAPVELRAEAVLRDALCQRPENVLGEGNAAADLPAQRDIARAERKCIVL